MLYMKSVGTHLDDFGQQRRIEIRVPELALKCVHWFSSMSLRVDHRIRAQFPTMWTCPSGTRAQ